MVTTHRIVAASVILATPSLHAQLAGPLNFEIAGQLSGNFRATANGPTASEGSDGTNGYLQVLGGTGTTPWIGVYDTTPGDALDPTQTFSGAFTVHFDISAANTSSSFGIFLFDPSSTSNNLLTIFNLDTATGGAGNEQIRFWRDTAITGSAVSNPYATTAFTGTNGTYDAGTSSWLTTAANRGNQTIDSASPYTFYSLNFTYDPVALTLAVTTGDFSATLNIPAADAIANPALAIRINDAVVDAGNTAKVDNFVVVPEPASASLLALGSLGFVRRRRC